MEIRLVESDPHRECMANLRYSAPVVMLSLKSSFSRDIWSIVCTLVEFVTGKVHFRSAQHTKAEYLAVIEGFTGSRIEDWECRAIDGEYRGRFRMLCRSPLHLHRDNMRGTKYIDQIIPRKNAFSREFADLMKKVFVLDLANRSSAKEALQHDRITKYGSTE
ncbi:hypothetical protein FOMG_20016 [Fusarium oxysporum f. sp. melonis 26406]|uniref:Protein kinase domain-containing protein n=1 Tax=Fusarium oxysporum f. sp. melonis 26406 TaxID=1089452 RepID=W9YUF6_FUSOX|nr:hypothetical protein FOMG_20016 [Fusarium oxysporum f. sp. melonis 26406]